MHNCPTCGDKAIARYGILETLIGYHQFTDDDGNVHKHNDNCLKQNYECPRGHIWKLSEQRKCDVEGCDWVGIDTCFCHPGKKIDSFNDSDIPLVKNYSKMS